MINPTTGPYKVVKAPFLSGGLKRSQDFGIVAGEHLIGEVFEIIGYQNEGEFVRMPAEANAQLFAASWDMMVALNTIVQSWQGDGTANNKMADAMAACAQRALMKAGLLL